jgi:hypothetical protein
MKFLLASILGLLANTAHSATLELDSAGSVATVTYDGSRVDCDAPIRATGLQVRNIVL